jgi:hypothetical protein
VAQALISSQFFATDEVVPDKTSGKSKKGFIGVFTIYRINKEIA